MAQPGFGGGYPNQNYGSAGAGYPPQPGYGPPPPGYGQPQGFGQPGGPGFNIGAGQPGYGPSGQPGYGGGGYPGSPVTGIAEDGNYDGNMAAFGSKSVRLAFIRKVYSILSVQLIVTFGFVLIFSLSDGSKGWAARNQGLLFLAFGVSIGSMLTLACCGSVRRQFPQNFICLGIFTLAQAFLLGFVTAFYNTQSVVLAVAMTAAVCIGLTIFAMQTKIDFTPLSGIMFVALIILMMMGFILMFFKIPFLQTVYAAAGALIFCIYLIIDTQMIIGGNHKNQISPEEYIFAAITLYTDIINIFLFILQLLGNKE
ncbi:Protein lifeguard 1 [Halotydeus destructor]|nr:Protein lifeguard 1 [Halotydeus destructor]